MRDNSKPKPAPKLPPTPRHREMTAPGQIIRRGKDVADWQRRHKGGR